MSAAASHGEEEISEGEDNEYGPPKCCSGQSKVGHAIEILGLCSFEELKEVKKAWDMLVPGRLKSFKTKDHDNSQAEADVLRPLPPSVGTWI
jgi:hypothetical protein